MSWDNDYVPDYKLDPPDYWEEPNREQDVCIEYCPHVHLESCQDQNGYWECPIWKKLHAKEVEKYG